MLTFNHILQHLKNIRYTPNTLSNKQHEQLVEKTLETLGLTSNQTLSCYYIKEPNGSQAPPDFRIVLNQTSLDIECKSCKTGYKPMWNATYPHPDCLYIFSNQTDNETLLFKGDTITTPTIQNILTDYKKANRQLHDYYNQQLTQLSLDENPFRIQVYPRNMFIQKKHLDKTHKKQYLDHILYSLQTQ